jgi:hypothetical protein
MVMNINTNVVTSQRIGCRGIFSFDSLLSRAKYLTFVTMESDPFARKQVARSGASQSRNLAVWGSRNTNRHCCYDFVVAFIFLQANYTIYTFKKSMRYASCYVMSRHEADAF